MFWVAKYQTVAKRIDIRNLEAPQSFSMMSRMRLNTRGFFSGFAAPNQLSWKKQEMSL